MFTIVIPGKISSINIRFPNATEALKKYREMEADGSGEINLRDSKGEEFSVQALEQQVLNEIEEQPS